MINFNAKPAKSVHHNDDINYTEILSVRYINLFINRSA